MNRKGVFFSLTALLIIGVLYITIVTQPVQSDDELDKLRVLEIIETHESIVETILPNILKQQSIIVLESLAHEQIVSGFATFRDQASIRRAFIDCMEEADVTQSCFYTAANYPRDLANEMPPPPGYEILPNPDGANPGGVGIEDILDELYYEEAGVQVLEDVTVELETYFDSIGLELTTTLEPGTVTISQISPWSLRVTAAFRVILTDDQDLGGQYESVETVETEVPVEGLTDPWGLSRADPGAIPRRIRKGELGEEDVDAAGRTVWKPETVNKHASEALYMYDSEGPSYLQRLAGVPNGDSFHVNYGLRSLLPPGTLWAQQSVDYWDDPAPDCVYVIVHDTDEVRLDPFFYTQAYLVAEYYLHSPDPKDQVYPINGNC